MVATHIKFGKFGKFGKLRKLDKLGGCGGAPRWEPRPLPGGVDLLKAAVMWIGATYTRDESVALGGQSVAVGCGRRDLVYAARRRAEVRARSVHEMMAMRAMLVVAGVMFVLCSTWPAVSQVRFASEKQAFTQGFSAYKGRQYDIAVPALKFAATHGVMRAKFYLAKIYSDNSGGWTDHARAYALLREIITSYGNVDPKDYRVAPFVSQALTSIARYEREGIKALGLAPNTARALVFFEHAATHFNDADAQFELAKHSLAGDGVKARVPYALNWLARLSKRGHAGAQAFLANLYWDGRYTVRDPVRALALITVAVENASEEDRFWIEDVHQNIFCEADVETRLRVRDVVGGWRQRFGRPQSVSAPDPAELKDLNGIADRTCANGDIVGDLDATPRRKGALSVSGVSERMGAQSGKPMSRVKPAPSDKSILNGFGLREAGTPADQLRVSRPDEEPRPMGTAGGGAPKSSLNGFIMQGATTGLGRSGGQ